MNWFLLNRFCHLQNTTAGSSSTCSQIFVSIFRPKPPRHWGRVVLHPTRSHPYSAAWPLCMVWSVCFQGCYNSQEVGGKLKVSLKRKSFFSDLGGPPLGCAGLVEDPGRSAREHLLSCCPSSPCPHRAPCTNVLGLFSCCSFISSTSLDPKWTASQPFSWWRDECIQPVKQPAEICGEIVTCICHKPVHQPWRGAVLFISWSPRQVYTHLFNIHDLPCTHACM